MTDVWKPIHDNHAIDVMAIVLPFSSPLPPTLLKRLIRQIEISASQLGLSDAQPVTGMEIQFRPDAPPSSSLVTGQVFSSRFPNDEGLPTSRIAEQIQIDAGGFIYRTWSYVSWSWQLERIKGLLTDLFSLISGIVPVANLRLEYLDRFYYTGSSEEANPAILLRNDCRYIAPHVFNLTGMWHSYSGAMLEDGPVRQRVLQLAIDAVDAFDDVSQPKKRWINMMTARENRYAYPGQDNPIEISAEIAFDTLSEMHGDLTSLLKALITDDMAEQIYLKV